MHEPSGKYFAGDERYTDLLQDSGISISLKSLENDNKINEILSENVPNYHDINVDRIRGESTLKLWTASPVELPSLCI